jgi:hypothetical protein
MRPASFVRRVKLEVKAAWVSFQFCSSSLQVVAYSLFLFSAILHHMLRINTANVTMMLYL